MQEFLTTKRDEIAELCRKHHVRRLAVFGSAAREDFDPSRSDVDVLVEFEDVGPLKYFDNKTDFWAALTTTIGKPVDLLTWASIRNPYLSEQVEETQEYLYAA